MLSTPMGWLPGGDGVGGGGGGCNGGKLLSFLLTINM